MLMNKFLGQALVFMALTGGVGMAKDVLSIAKDLKALTPLGNDWRVSLQSKFNEQFHNPELYQSLENTHQINPELKTLINYVLSIFTKGDKAREQCVAMLYTFLQKQKNLLLDENGEEATATVSNLTEAFWNYVLST